MVNPRDVAGERRRKRRNTKCTWTLHTHAGDNCTHTSTQVLGTTVPTQVLKCWGQLYPHKSLKCWGQLYPHKSLKCWGQLYPHVTQVLGTTVPTQVTQVLGTTIPTQVTQVLGTTTHTSTQVLGTTVPTQVLKCWVQLYLLKCFIFHCCESIFTAMHVVRLVPEFWLSTHWIASRFFVGIYSGMLRSSLCVFSLISVPETASFGLVVKASASGVEDQEFDSHLCCGDFSRSSHTSDLEIETRVTTLPSAWHYKVSAGTGQPGVSVLWLCEEESWSATSISVWQYFSEQIRPWDTLACCWDVKQPANTHHHARVIVLRLECQLCWIC